jgi:hypothetical protein
MAQEQFAFFLAGFYANSHKTPNKKSMGETVDILEYCPVIRMACYLDPKTSFGYYSDPSNTTATFQNLMGLAIVRRFFRCDL